MINYKITWFENGRKFGNIETFKSRAIFYYLNLLFDKNREISELKILEYNKDITEKVNKFLGGK